MVTASDHWQLASENGEAVTHDGDSESRTVTVTRTVTMTSRRRRGPASLSPGRLGIAGPGPRPAADARPGRPGLQCNVTHTSESLPVNALATERPGRRRSLSGQAVGAAEPLPRPETRPPVTVTPAPAGWPGLRGLSGLGAPRRSRQECRIRERPGVRTVVASVLAHCPAAAAKQVTESPAGPGAGAGLGPGAGDRDRDGRGPATGSLVFQQPSASARRGPVPPLRTCCSSSSSSWSPPFRVRGGSRLSAPQSLSLSLSLSLLSASIANKLQRLARSVT